MHQYKALAVSILATTILGSVMLRGESGATVRSDHIDSLSCAWRRVGASQFPAAFAASATSQDSSEWLLYGGVNRTGDLSDDAMVISLPSSGGLSTPLETSSVLGSEKRLGAAAAFRETGDLKEAIVFGGVTELAESAKLAQNTLRVQQDASIWKQETLQLDGINLQPRAFASMVHVPPIDAVLIVGGATNCDASKVDQVPRCSESSKGTQFLLFDGEGRATVAAGPNGGPGDSFAHSAFYDAEANSVYVIGGTRDSETPDSSAYRLRFNGIDRDSIGDLRNWESLSDFCSNATARMFHSASLIPEASLVGIAGGVRSLKSTVELSNQAYVIDFGSAGRECVADSVPPLRPVGASMTGLRDDTARIMWTLVGGLNGDGDVNDGQWVLECEKPTPTATPTSTATPTPSSNCPFPREEGVYLFRGDFGPQESCYFITASVRDLADTPLDDDGEIRIGTVCEEPAGKWEVRLFRQTGFQPGDGDEFGSCTSAPGSGPAMGAYRSVMVGRVEPPTPETFATHTPLPTGTATGTPTSTSLPTVTATATSSPTPTDLPSSTPSSTPTLSSAGCDMLHDAVCFCRGEGWSPPCIAARTSITNFEESALLSNPQSVWWTPEDWWRVRLYTAPDLEPTSFCAEITIPQQQLGSICPSSVQSAELLRIPTSTPSPTGTSTASSTPEFTPTSTPTELPSATPTITPSATARPCELGNNVVFWIDVIGGECVETTEDVFDFSSTVLGETGAGFVCSDPPGDWSVTTYSRAGFKDEDSAKRMSGCQPIPGRALSARVQRVRRIYIPFTESSNKDALCYGDLAVESESNDSFGDASRIFLCSDERLIGRLADEDKLDRDLRDLAQLNHVGPGVVRVAVDDVSDDGSIELRMFRRDREEAVAISTVAPGARRTELDLRHDSRVGYYFAALVGLEDRTRSTGLYTLRWSADWLTGEREPNDWIDATLNERALGPSTPPIRGRFSSIDLSNNPLCEVPPFRARCERGERTDHYRLVMLNDGVAEIDFERPQPACGYLKFALWDSRNMLVDPQCDSPDRVGSRYRAIYSLAAGEYSVQVSHYTSGSEDCSRFQDGDSSSYYELKWEIESVSVCDGR